MRLRTNVALLAAVILIAGCGSPAPATPSPIPVPSPTVAAAPPGASPSSSPATGAPSPRPGTETPPPSPAGSPVTWDALALPPLVQVAELTADDVDVAGADARTSFTLRSLDGTPAITLARGLTVEPAVELAVRQGSDRTRAIVRPRESLAPGGTYRFTLAAPDGMVAGGWAFVVAAPPKVVGTLPSDRTTEVPVDTGIEIAFDRDGVADPTRWFSITPKVTGRFERHDRTWAFVPDALAPSTVYTVTLRAGVPLEGSDLALETPVELRFRTAGPEKPHPVSIQPATVVAEVPTGEPPIVAIAVTSRGEVRPPKSVRVTLYRVPDLLAASTIASDLVERQQDWWFEEVETPRDTVDTSSLAVAARLSVPLILDTRDGYAGALRFQRALAQGWYLVDLPDDIAAGEQVLLQVTPVAAYAAMARDRTLVWANRVGVGPIAGATVRLADGAAVGVTGSDGLMLATTPPEVLATIDPEEPGRTRRPILIVEAPGLGAVVVPVGTSAAGDVWSYRSNDWEPSAGVATSRLSSTLSTDRSTYRRTDSIAAWGMVRDAATGASPRTVRLELTPAGAEAWGWDWSMPARTPVAVADAGTSRLGVFTATLDVADLPLGSYELTLLAGERRLGSQWIEIGVVRKPAYTVDVSVDHRAVMAGDPVVVTGTAAFYDGTPVRGLPLRLTGSAENGDGVTVSTGPDGRASTLTHPSASGYAAASTSGAELGEVGSTEVRVEVFPSAYEIGLDTADIVGEAVRVAGSVRNVDLDRVEAAIAADEPYELVGPPASGVPVRVEVSSTVWVARRTGTAYDFILKKAVPVYAYDERQLPTVTGTARTAADGGYALRLALPREARGLRAQVQVQVIATDARGRQDIAWSWGDRREQEPKSTLHTVWLDPGPDDDARYGPEPCSWSWQSEEYGIGETVRLTLRDGRGPIAAGPSTRFLFVTTRDGIRDATLSTSPRYRRLFDASETRGLTVLGVAFDGQRYRAAAGRFHAYVDPATRSIVVTVASDLAPGAVHAPGDPAWVRVATKDRSGRPLAADVVVRAIDEKLYDAGMAWDGGDLWYEYGSGDGVMGTFVSHVLPERISQPGCGSTTGGGGGPGGGGAIRTDFRDRVLFARVRTGPDGTARVPFHLSDDLTSWRVTASAVTDDLRTGTGSVNVPVGLPFFIEPVTADTVLAMDVPGVVLRAFGSALRTGDVVRYTVRAPTLASAPITVNAAAFTVGVAWVSRVGAAMPLGTHRIVVEATVRTAGRILRDAKEMTIAVVATGNGVRTTRTMAVEGDARPPGGDDALTTCTITDAGRASLVPLLQELARGGPRADQAAAAAAARDLLAEQLGQEAWGSRAFDPAPYLVEGHGVSLLPYSSPDVGLTALVALGAPEAFPRTRTEVYLEDTARSTGEPRDRRIVATVGLAALGFPVLDDLRAAAAASDLTPTERAWLAVGLGEAGDLAGAAAMERALLAELGQRSGAWARVIAGSTAHASIEATALLAIVAARIGDPLAPDLEAYVLDAEDTEAVHTLEGVAYAARALDHLPRTTARVAYTIQGHRSEADLGPHRSVRLVLTPSQRTDTVVRTLDGAASMVCAWDAPAAGDDLPHDPALSIVRSVEPAGPIPPGSLVAVRLSVAMGAGTPSGFYQVAETLPAGLAPTNDWAMERAADGDDDEDVFDREQHPWSIEGNRAEWGFWWGAGNEGRTLVFRVTARVVAPGGYAWEPAVVQLLSAPTVGAATAASGITVLAP